MAEERRRWRKGRGLLGPLQPLIGSWVAEAPSPQGPVTCRRRFSPLLGGSFIELRAVWELPRSTYEELAVFGRCEEGQLSFWSFTSDGKRSEGRLAEAEDMGPEAVVFHADMPAGLARMLYWPDEEGGFHWAVESASRKGWRRFLEHHYRRAAEG